MTFNMSLLDIFAPDAAVIVVDWDDRSEARPAPAAHAYAAVGKDGRATAAAIVREDGSVRAVFRNREGQLVLLEPDEGVSGEVRAFHAEPTGAHGARRGRGLASGHANGYTSFDACVNPKDRRVHFATLGLVLDPRRVELLGGVSQAITEAIDMTVLTTLVFESQVIC
jgi:hypothetical protein